jgi:gamma-glutamylcyclotransferase (GGCT)/AIG2-like uncharacterized protein YtfP
MTHRVFVYGSLKRGHWNSALLGDAVFKGEAVTEQRYYMLSGSVQGSRAFPVILDDDPALSVRPVAGEIYHVSDERLVQLDRLERVPDSYERKIAEVMEDGHPVKAYIYVGNPARWKRSGWPLWTGVNANGALVWIEM